MNFKVDIAVCGRFHFHKYIKYIPENILNKVYCSYKLNYDFGIPSKKVKNYFLKEYLMYFNIRVLKGWNFKKYLTVCHRFWEYQVLFNTVNASILHIMIHGNGLKVMKKYKRNGAIIIGEAVNAYPPKQIELLKNERAQYNLNFPVENYERMIEEFKICDYILVASTFVKKSFTDYGFDPTKIITIPYGTENSFKEKRTPDKAKCYKIVCVGQITFRKGQRYLMEAVNSLKKQGMEIELTLIGKVDSEYNKFLNFEGHCHIPHIDNHKIEEFLRKFDLFVLPSIEDGFSVAVTEALSAGLPVITTNTNGSADLITDYDNGFVINPFSNREIEIAIVKAMATSFPFNKKPISWKEYAINLSEEYKKILNKENWK